MPATLSLFNQLPYIPEVCQAREAAVWTFPAEAADFGEKDHRSALSRCLAAPATGLGFRVEGLGDSNPQNAGLP